MKTSFNTIYLLITTVLILTQNIANTQSLKGGQRLKELVAVKTTIKIDQLKTGDTFAMACSKCKTIWVSQVRKDAKGAELLKANGVATKLLGKHLCSGCGSQVVITGHGKGREVKLKHTCQTCGEHSPFCCATVSLNTEVKKSTTTTQN